MTTPPEACWTFHGTAAVHSYDDTLAWLARFCGCRALEYSDNADPLVARKGGVTWLGDNGLELMEPTQPEGGPARFLERFGPGMYALALQVEDLPAAAAHFDASGVEIVGETERGFIFTKPQHTEGIYFEWADERWYFDPRFDAELPPPPPGALIDTPRIAYWGALVADPAAALARFGQLWSAPILLQKLDAPPHEPAVVLGIPDGAFALYRLPPDAAQLESLWGPGVLRPRHHLMAMRVRDLAAAEDVFRREGVRILRGSAREGEIVTHPADTTGVPLAWTDRDVPGDARGPLV